MAETSNDDDVKSNKRSHADFTGDDGSGMSPPVPCCVVFFSLPARASAHGTG